MPANLLNPAVVRRPMTLSEWKAINDTVADEMNRHTKPFTSPISASIGSAGRHVGTGSFLMQRGRRLLLSCAHVFASGKHYRFNGTDKVWDPGAPVRESLLLDLAFIDIGDRAWSMVQHQAQAFPYARFAKRYEIACPEELLFFRGFAGENSSFMIDTLTSNASGYVSQEVKGSGSDQFFEIFWDPGKTQYSAGSSNEARNQIRYLDPHGFSGSLVWNTRYLELTQAGKRWTPRDAVVVGMAQRWDEIAKTLLVRRVEHMRPWLDDMTPRWTAGRAVALALRVLRAIRLRLTSLLPRSGERRWP